MNDTPGIGILGPGAVGQMLAFFIRRVCPIPIQVIGRQGRQAINSAIEWDGKRHTLVLDDTVISCKLLLVAVKSYHLRAALEAVLPSVPDSCVLVILGNGYIEPLIRPLRERYPQHSWRKGIVTYGVRKQDDGSYSVSRQGEVSWGDQNAPTEIEEQIFDLLKQYRWEWRDDICSLRREKWFFNTSLNTLCGAYRLPSNGDAMRLFRQELEALAKEVHTLGMELWSDWRVEWEYLWLRLQNLIQATAKNENSMARDIRLGRPTEADVLSGYFLQASDPKRFPLLEYFHKRLTVD